MYSGYVYGIARQRHTKPGLHSLLIKLPSDISYHGSNTHQMDPNRLTLKARYYMQTKQYIT